MLEQEKRKAARAEVPAADQESPAVRDPMLEESLRSAKFMSAHYQEFSRQYPGQWVGVYLEEVVAVAPTTREILEQAAAQGVPCGNMHFSFMRNGKGIRCWTPFRIERRA